MGFFDFLKRRKKVRYILSIDGGGMRGIIPSYILSQLDQALKKEGDERPFYSHFDLVAGTSTGALIALALTTPPSLTAFNSEAVLPYITKKGTVIPGADPSSFERIYIEHGSEIFPKNDYLKNILYPILTEKYDALPLERLLAKWFKDARMDDALVPTLALSYSTTEGRIYKMRSWEEKGLAIKDVARASTAAPMYFSPFTLDSDNEKHFLIDGGVAANNPALIAYSEAKKLYQDAHSFKILSLSTCSPRYTFDPREIPGGITGWANPTIKIYGQGAMEIVDETMEAIDNVEYIRIWAPVIEREIKLDATDPDSIELLKNAAKMTYSESEEKLKAFVQEIKNRTYFDNVRLQRTDSTR